MEDQLDDAVAFGCNAVRVMGSITGIHRGNYTRAAYLALWDDLNDMCETRGLYLYPCMQPGGTGDAFGDLPQTYLEAEGEAWAAHVNAYNNCIGIDVVQENHAYGSSSNGLALLRVLRRVTDLPLTYSIVGGTPSQLGHADNTAAVNSLINRVDFVDLHWYYNPASTAVEQYWWDAGYAKPLVIGEFGEDEAAGDAAQTAHYTAVAAAMAHAGDSGRRSAGAFAWCARDFVSSPSSNQWGLSTAAGVARTEMTVPFQTIPKT